MTSMRAGTVRLLLAVAAPLVLVIAIGVYYNYRNEYRDTEATARRVVDITVADTAAFVKDVRAKLDALVQRPLVQAMDPQRCDAALKDMLSFSPRFAYISTVDREGYFVCAAVPPPAGNRLRIEDPEMHRRIVEERSFQISKPLQGGITKRWSIAFAAPVSAGDGTVVGAVGIGVDLVGWPFIARSAPLPDDTVIGLIDSEGTVVAHSEQAAERVGRSARGIESVETALARREGSARGKGRGDRDVIFAFRAVPETDWIVLVGIPVGAAFVDSHESLVRSGALGAAAILLAALIAVALERRISGQVRRIAETARSVARGATGERARVEGIAEIAEIATQFNAMLDAQERRSLALGHQVEMREVITQLSQRALVGPPLEALFDEAAAKTARALRADRCAVHRLEPGGRVDAPAGGGAAVVIGRPERPFGMLEVHRREPRGFAAEETDFLTAVANLLALAAEKHALEQQRDALGLERGLLLERLELQLERMPILCVMYDERLLVSYVNPTAVRTLGWSREEMVGRLPFETFIPPDRRATVEAIFARLRAGEYVHASGEGLCKDGTRVLLEWVNTPLHREDGTFIGLMSMAQDVTERAQAQEVIADSEQRYRVMFESNPLPMWVIDRGTQAFLAVNDAAVTHYGYSRREFLAMTVSDIRLAADRAWVAESLQTRQDSMQRGVRTHLRKGGEAIDVEVAFQDIEFAGRPARIVLSHDVTDKLRAERALRESEERFRALASLSADGFWEQDENFRYTALSQGGVLERRGMARNDIIGFAPPWELPGVESLDGSWEEYRALLAAHRPYRDHRFRRTLRDGTVRYATASGEPRFAPDGRFIGYRGVSSDVTERVRAEEAIRKLNAELEDRVRQRTEQLEEANRELEAFSYSVSHDLRAPLRHIDGFARRLEKVMTVSPEAALRDLGIIRGAAKRMGELIDDLLALSRTARAPVNVRRVELGPLARELAGQTPPELGASEIRWRIGKLPAVLADPSLMRIVLQNLISNAVKYSRQRAIAEIEIGALRNPQGETVVYVRDNGVGFDMRFAEKLFGVFQRLHREEDFEGTGIGLATVRRILHRHGWRIWGEAEPDKGATFSFTVAVSEDQA